MYSVFLSSYTNTRKSLGELEKAVETLACSSCSHSISRSPKLLLVFLFSNYSPKARWILSNNPRDEVEGIIRQYSLSLRGIIVLVLFQNWKKKE